MPSDLRSILLFDIAPWTGLWNQFSHCVILIIQQGFNHQISWSDLNTITGYDRSKWRRLNSNGSQGNIFKAVCVRDIRYYLFARNTISGSTMGWYLLRQAMSTIQILLSRTPGCTCAGGLRSIYPSPGTRLLFVDVTMGKWRHNQPTLTEHTMASVPDVIQIVSGIKYDTFYLKTSIEYIFLYSGFPSCL